MVLATDGVFDNVFDEEVVETVESMSSKSEDEVAKAIATQVWCGVCVRARSPNCMQASMMATSSRQSPFARGAARVGFHFEGGKVDDITVVVATVARESA